jgi:hypothetical protein
MSELEERLAEARLELIQAELERLKTPKQKEGFWNNPLIIAVVGATATAIVGLVTNQIQVSASRQLERDKLESSLILKAIDANDPTERLLALKFLVNVGLVSDSQGKISSLQAEEIPRIQQQSNSMSGSTPTSLPITYSQKLVDKILKQPGVPYSSDVGKLEKSSDVHIVGIILHYAYGPDSSVKIMRDGRSDLPGPMAHWAVLSDGRIELIADERRKANHVGRADRGLNNSNTIGIQTTGLTAFEDEQQVENLVRLVVDVADRWSIPTEMIVSHAEVAKPAGRKTDMDQQAPAVREMVDAVRKGRLAQQSVPADSAPLRR